MKAFSHYWTDELGKAITENAPNIYPMDLNSGDAESVRTAVNRGIDSHLQACYVPSRGDRYDCTLNRMSCLISKESLPVLIRRLLENGDENGLASGICQTIGIELI